MAGYMFLYRDGDKAKVQLSPEQMQAYMQSWMDWIGEAMEAGWMTAPGDALKPGGKTINADKSVTDGPFAESKEIVGGYSIIQADSLEAAIELANGCPVFTEGGSVEIRELANVAVEAPAS